MPEGKAACTGRGPTGCLLRCATHQGEAALPGVAVGRGELWGQRQADVQIHRSGAATEAQRVEGLLPPGVSTRLRP